MKNQSIVLLHEESDGMEVSSLLSLPEGLHVEWIEPQGADLSVGVVSTCPSSCCPLCAQASSQIHSRYQRTLRDVPCGDRKVVLHLSVRKFFCHNPDCTRKIFTERLSSFVEPWAQVTIRLFEAVQAIGLATCGELGTRLADRIRFHASPKVSQNRELRQTTHTPLLFDSINGSNPIWTDTHPGNTPATQSGDYQRDPRRAVRHVQPLPPVDLPAIVVLRIQL
jgi:hypothetical protein